MWGGIVAVLNFIPYLGPIGSALLLFFGGLMTFPDVWSALLPPLIFTGLHMVEANLITPMIVGKRLTISPLAILVSLSFWAWVWGTTGALLAVPLLIIMKTIFSRRRHARHRRFPVRTRHVDPCAARKRRKKSPPMLTAHGAPPSSPPRQKRGCSSVG